MSEPSFVWKKDRNQKRRNDAHHKKRNHPQNVSTPEKPNSSVASGVAGPQPQRANRRDRAEQKSKEGESPTSAADKKEVEQPVVDHSHLKRETEEIEKLTKKFSKREVVSNWHRYSATDESQLMTASDNRDEDESLADFSDLLQVPSSRGGHLQLKDEQDWAAASGVLGEYFALDLKVLSQSLACISIYDLLQLPKQVFSEEEIDIFDDSARHAKKCYSVDKKVEDPSRNILQVLTSLESQKASPEISLENESTELKTQDCFNILDFNKSKQTLLDLDMSLGNEKYSDEFLIEDVKRFENVLTSINSSKDNTRTCKNKLPVIKNEPNLENSIEKDLQSIGQGLDININNEHINEVKERSQTNSYDSPSVNKIHNRFKSEEDIVIPKDMRTVKKNFSKSESSPTESPQVSPDKVTAAGPEINLSKEETKPIPPNITQSVKSFSETKSISLEEDEDLDFLLTLKNPVAAQNEKNESTVVLKDSSFLPGMVSSAQSAAVAQSRSELDSWLDSVLED